MNILYAPWRNEYTTSTANTKNENLAQDQCVFCSQLAENNDLQYFILKRFTYSYIMLNLYPYNAGHLLILPFAHQPELSNLPKDARTELIELTTHSNIILKETLGAQGINMGYNIGKAAGAGIPSHLHFHVLPRWIGDTNFLPTLTQTKQISFDLKEIYQKLKPRFEEIVL